MNTIPQTRHIIAALDSIHRVPPSSLDQELAVLRTRNELAMATIRCRAQLAPVGRKPQPVGLDQQGQHQTRRAVDWSSTDGMGYEAADVRAVTAADVASHPDVLQAEHEIERHKRMIDRLCWVMAGLAVAGAAVLTWWPQ